MQQIVSRDLYDSTVKLIEGFANNYANKRPLKQSETEAYLNTMWKIAKEYERKVISKEKEQ